MDVDLLTEPLGLGADGEPVYLGDVWPSAEEVRTTVEAAIRAEMFEKNYADVFEGDERWNAIEIPEGERYPWPESTYVRKPPYFDGMGAEPAEIEPIEGAYVLAMLGDSVTTDHISPAGAIRRQSPAGQWLLDNEVEPRDYNSYGSRRGNHDVMNRATLANVMLRNALVEREGGYTRHLPSGEEMTIYDAAVRYASEGHSLVLLAGKDYGSGSSRDWAAKGPSLLGVRAVIAESLERIHRSNLIGMGVLPLQLPEGETHESLGLTGEERFTIGELESPDARTVAVRAEHESGRVVEFDARVRLDTPNEREYYRHGGILHRVLRDLRERGHG